LSRTVAQNTLQVEKGSSDKSPAVQGVPALCLAYERRLEAAREQFGLIKQVREPAEAKLGIGEVSLQEADPVPGKLDQITQQLMHVVQACNEENTADEEGNERLNQSYSKIHILLKENQVKIVTPGG